MKNEETGFAPVAGGGGRRILFSCFLGGLPGRLKGLARGLSVRVAAAPPFGAVFDDPVGQGALEADVAAGLLGLDPLVPEYLLALGLELAIEVGIPNQVVAGNIFVFVRHTAITFHRHDEDRVCRRLGDSNKAVAALSH